MCTTSKNNLFIVRCSKFATLSATTVCNFQGTHVRLACKIATDNGVVSLSSHSRHTKRPIHDITFENRILGTLECDVRLAHTNTELHYRESKPLKRKTRASTKRHTSICVATLSAIELRWTVLAYPKVGSSSMHFAPRSRFSSPLVVYCGARLNLISKNRRDVHVLGVQQRVPRARAAHCADIDTQTTHCVL